MNIFVLDEDPFKAATFHGDVHVSKLAIEAAQLLSTAHHLLGTRQDRSLLYAVAHENHPCAIWVRAREANYSWTFKLLFGLLREYELRYGRTHATAALLPLLVDHPLKIAYGLPRSEFVNVTPHRLGSVVASYRHYYRTTKRDLVMSQGWRTVSRPDWF